VMAHWMFQSSGSFFLLNYFLDTEVRKHPDRKDYWRTTDQFNRISKDDTVFIWKAELEPDRELAPRYFKYKGYKNLLKIPGIYATAKVIKPKLLSSIYNLDGPACLTSEYYVDTAEKKERMLETHRWAEIEYTNNIVDKPLPQNLLWEYRFKKDGWILPGLEDLWTTMRFTSRGIYYVSDPQAKIIKKLILKHNGLTVP
jgi:hypothetical protein